jgi:TRAP-type C4-dicarboxylate transport system substrate-binding protein
LLDLPEGALTDKFLGDPKNLELYKRVMNAETAEIADEAYDELMYAAQQSIIDGFDIPDTAKEKFKSKLEEFQDLLDIENLEVGVDVFTYNQGFFNDLQRMLNEAGATAEQASAILSSMGVDAEVVSVQKTEPKTVAYNTQQIPEFKDFDYYTIGGKASAQAVRLRT